MKKKKSPWLTYAEKITEEHVEQEDFFEDFGEDIWSCNQ